MKEFLLIFRNVPPAGDANLSPEELKKNVSKPWQDWIGSIAAQNKLASIGGRLAVEGATLKGDAVTDGPYAEIKEIVLGYIAVKASTLAEAVEISKGCPALPMGGSVEVRELVQMG